MINITRIIPSNLVFAGFASLLTASSVAAQAPTGRLFDTWVANRTGDLPSARHAGGCELFDLDGDGYLDVVYARVGYVSQVPYPSPGIGVMLGDGTGALSTPAVEYDAFTVVQQLAGSGEYIEPSLADLDGDGWIDAVVPLPGTFSSGSEVAIFHGRGNGTFDPVQREPVGGSATGVAIADFDGDGDLDLGMALYDGGSGTSVSILRNAGNRNYGAPVQYAAGARPYKIAAGDIDGDGDSDLAVTNAQSKVNILFNAGNANFTSSALHSGPSPASPTDFGSVRIGDIDNDGDADVVFGNVFTTAPGNTGAAFGVFRNPGNGDLGAYEGYLIDFASNAGLHILKLADLDQDGWLDVLTLCTSGTSPAGWFYCRGDGGGGFLPSQSFVGFSAGHHPRGLAVGDMNNDLELDVVTSARDSSEVGVHLNPGNEDFSPGTKYDTGMTQMLAVAVADFELDGDIDIATCSSADDVQLYTNDGSGGLTLTASFPELGSENVEFFDMNGDPYLDLVYMTGFIAHVAINQADGSFAAPVEYQLQVTDPGDTGAFDVDNDGDLDLCVSTRLIPFNRFISISLNNGDGTLAPDYLITVDINPFPLAGADFNEDGNIDLITGHPKTASPTGWLNVSLGNGDGTFQPFYRVTTGNSTGDFVAEDLDHDGHIDLVATAFDSQTQGVGAFVTHSGNGDGTFQPFVKYPYGGGDIFATDVNGDGELDLAMELFGAEGVNLALGRGDGTFEPHDRRYGSIGPATDVAVADLTGDGLPEMIVIGSVEQGGTPVGAGYLLVLEGELACVEPEIYCQGKVNSLGFPPPVGVSGTPSVSQNDLVLGVTTLIPSKAGLFFRGAGKAQIPFFNGTLCTNPPLMRGPVFLTDTFGSASYAVDIGPMDLGLTWNFQAWLRDPQHLDGTGVSLSNAVEILVCP